MTAEGYPSRDVHDLRMSLTSVTGAMAYWLGEETHREYPPPDRTRLQHIARAFVRMRVLLGLPDDVDLSWLLADGYAQHDLPQEVGPPEE